MGQLAVSLCVPTAIALAVSIMVFALSAGMTDPQPIVGAALLGFALGMPVPYAVAPDITNRG